MTTFTSTICSKALPLQTKACGGRRLRENTSRCCRSWTSSHPTQTFTKAAPGSARLKRASSGRSPDSANPSEPEPYKLARLMRGAHNRRRGGKPLKSIKGLGGEASPGMQGGARARLGNLVDATSSYQSKQ